MEPIALQRQMVELGGLNHTPRSSDTRRELGAELLLCGVQRSRSRWFNCLIRTPVGPVPLEDPGVGPGLPWPRGTTGSPRRSRRVLLQLLLGEAWLAPCLACCHRDLTAAKWKKTDGWMDEGTLTSFIWLRS